MSPLFLHRDLIFPINHFSGILEVNLSIYPVFGLEDSISC